MIIEKQDAQVEVKVPAQNGRKGYSYFRNASAIKKGVAGAGAALALGGLAAAAIALRKKPEESNALPAPVEPPDPVIVPPSTASRVGEFAKKAAIGTGKTVAGVATSLAISKGISYATAPTIEKIRNKQYEAAQSSRAAKREAEIAAAEDVAERRRSNPRSFASDNRDFQEMMAKRAVRRVLGGERRVVGTEAFEKTFKEEVDKKSEALMESMVTVDRLPSLKPKIEVGGALTTTVKPQSATPPPPTSLPYRTPTPKPSSSALTIAPSESGENTGNAIAKPQKTLLTKVSGSAGAALGRLVRKGKEGWERDRQAGGISSFQDKEYDVNQLANKAGKGTRSVAESVANFAQSFYSTFVDKDNAIDVKAEEVKEPATQKRIRGVTIRALPQGGKRGRGRPKTKFAPKDFINPENKRQESLYSRIDSFIQSLEMNSMTYTSSDLPIYVQENMDAQITVKVPATANRKAYEYTKNTGGSSATPKRKANVGLGVGLVAGSAAILGGLAATAAAKKGERDAEGERNSEALERGKESSRIAQEEIRKKAEQQRAEYKAKNPRPSEEETERARAKSADLQERMKKPIETAEESDAKRRAAGAKAIEENDKKRAKEAAEDEENKKRIKEEDYRKYQEYQKSPEYKKNIEKFKKYYKEKVREARNSPEYKEEKAKRKAARDAAREARKGESRKSGGGFSERRNSLDERIDAFLIDLPLRISRLETPISVKELAVNYDEERPPLSVQERMDAQITVQVPATAGRKAYSYIKNVANAAQDNITKRGFPTGGKIKAKGFSLKSRVKGKLRDGEEMAEDGKETVKAKISNVKSKIAALKSKIRGNAGQGISKIRAKGSELKGKAAGIAGKASDLKDSAKRKVSQGGEALRERGQALKGQAREQASSLKGRVENKASQGKASAKATGQSLKGQAKDVKEDLERKASQGKEAIKEKGQAVKSRLSGLKQRIRQNSLDERIDAFLKDLSSSL